MGRDFCCIDFQKLCVVRFFRSSLADLEGRLAFKGIHTIGDCDAVAVPNFVLQYLAKGSKFIPDLKRCTDMVVTEGLPALQRSLRLRAFFGNSEFCGEQRKCRPQSSWQPPPCLAADDAILLLRERLHAHVPRHVKFNLDWLDGRASSWLRSHADTMAVIDCCDKNLGDALVTRSWLRNACLEQLRLGFTALDVDEFKAKTSALQLDFIILLEQALAATYITNKDFASLRLAVPASTPSFHAGVFRVLAKVHKQPVGARPICSVSRTWIHPVGLFLVDELSALHMSLTHVVHSSDDFLSKVPEVLPAGYCMYTLDVINLYPSIDREHFMTVVAPVVRRVFPRGKANFLLQLIHVGLSDCFVLFDGSFYGSSSGIPTGFAPGVILANIYLSCFDACMVANVNCLWYYRLVDDVVLAAASERSSKPFGGFQCLASSDSV